MLIKNATLVSSTETVRADLLIRGEKIERIGAGLPAESEPVIEAAGKLVMPGGIDPHSHFDLPMFGTVSSDDHYTGHKAAAFGGTTTVIDFVPLESQGFEYSLDLWREKAGKAAVDYSFHMNLTRFDDQLARQMPLLRDAGITTVKVFTAYNGRLRIDDSSIFRALRVARDHGMLVMAHCENGDVIDLLVEEAVAAGHRGPEWHARTRPAWGAVESVLRVAGMAAAADAPVYIVHMNVAGEVDMLDYARARGVRVMGETCPQYLFFTAEELRRPDGAKWVCSPPFRTAADNARLWEGLGTGSVHVVGTDHCPFFFDGSKPIRYEGQPVAIPGKELGRDDFTKIPNGVPGVQDRLPVLWTAGVGSGRLTPNQFVALTSTNAARIFGLYPQKGALRPGSDADLVIWDPLQKVTYGVARSRHRTDYNLYEGRSLTGYPEKVFLRGQLIVDGDKWLGKAGQGRFVRRHEGEVL